MAKKKVKYHNIKENGEELTYSELKDKMGPNVKVEYLGNGDIKMTSIEERIINKKELKVTLSVKSQFIQIYLGFYENLIATDNSSAHHSLLTYILKYEMDKENYFTVNVSFYERFKKYIKSFGKEAYNDRYIRRVFGEMVDQEFFIKLQRGKYQVNPMGFWKGGKKDRIASIMELAEQELIELRGTGKESTKRIGQRQENGDVY